MIKQIEFTIDQQEEYDSNRDGPFKDEYGKCELCETIIVDAWIVLKIK